jgi:hypothetical protein
MLQSEERDFTYYIENHTLFIEFTNNLSVDDIIILVASSYFTEQEKILMILNNIDSNYDITKYGNLINVAEYYDQYLNKHYPNFALIPFVKTLESDTTTLETLIPYKLARKYYRF